MVLSILAGVIYDNVECITTFTYSVVHQLDRSRSMWPNICYLCELIWTVTVIVVVFV